MQTKAEIIAGYKEQHNVLSEAYYAGTSGLTKVEFDQQHATIWDGMRIALVAAGYVTEPADTTLHFLAGGSNANQRLAVIEDFLAGKYP